MKLCQIKNFGVNRLNDLAMALFRSFLCRCGPLLEEIPRSVQVASPDKRASCRGVGAWCPAVKQQVDFRKALNLC